MKAIDILREFEFKNPFASKEVVTPAPANPAQTLSKPPLPGQAISTKPAPAAAPAVPMNTKGDPEPSNIFNPANYKDLVIKLARKSGFTNDNDLSRLLGQISHETRNWAAPVEDMHYKTAEKIWGKFTSKFKSPMDPAEVQAFIWNPIALANRAYAGKNGNGDEASGDGWRYRGRGFMHITGRKLYRQAGEIVHPTNPDIYVNNPYLLSTNPTESALASIAYFKANIGLGKTTKQVSSKVNSRDSGAAMKAREIATQKEKKQLLQKKQPIKKKTAR